MTQRKRSTMANVLLGVSILCIGAFVVQHFMPSTVQTWHKDLAWLALAFATASEVARGRLRRRAMSNGD
jgi:hypothetical protein